MPEPRFHLLGPHRSLRIQEIRMWEFQEIGYPHIVRSIVYILENLGTLTRKVKVSEQ